jgi:DNA-binding NarL/FixJ family response regulator
MSVAFGDELSDREMQILHGMADGLSNAQIGQRLLISEDTVKTHARRLFRKLGARDRAHAVRLGLDGGALDRQQTRRRVRAALEAHRATRDEAPADCRYAQLYDSIEAALSEPPS